eukprot:Amastigsp_a521888_4.p2 type:complete len:152 gc:universal Amastigsp_a521888_4:229-684(+)
MRQEWCPELRVRPFFLACQACRTARGHANARAKTTTKEACNNFGWAPTTCVDQAMTSGQAKRRTGTTPLKAIRTSRLIQNARGSVRGSAELESMTKLNAIMIPTNEDTRRSSSGERALRAKQSQTISKALTPKNFKERTSSARTTNDISKL